MRLIKSRGAVQQILVGNGNVDVEVEVVGRRKVFEVATELGTSLTLRSNETVATFERVNSATTQQQELRKVSLATCLKSVVVFSTAAMEICDGGGEVEEIGRYRRFLARGDPRRLNVGKSFLLYPPQRKSVRSPGSLLP